MPPPNYPDPAVQVEREALKAALQWPAVVGPTFDPISEQAFTVPAFAEVRQVIAAAGGLASGKVGECLDRGGQGPPPPTICVRSAHHGARCRAPAHRRGRGRRSLRLVDPGPVARTRHHAPDRTNSSRACSASTLSTRSTSTTGCSANSGPRASPRALCASRPSESCSGGSSSIAVAASRRADCVEASCVCGDRRTHRRMVVAAADGWAVATPSALVVVAGTDDHQAFRIPWSRVLKATWTDGALRSSVRRTARPVTPGTCWRSTRTAC